MLLTLQGMTTLDRSEVGTHDGNGTLAFFHGEHKAPSWRQRRNQFDPDEWFASSQCSLALSNAYLLLESSARSPKNQKAFSRRGNVLSESSGRGTSR